MSIDLDATDDLPRDEAYFDEAPGSPARLRCQTARGSSDVAAESSAAHAGGCADGQGSDAEHEEAASRVRADHGKRYGAIAARRHLHRARRAPEASIDSRSYTRAEVSLAGGHGARSPEALLDRREARRRRRAQQDVASVASGHVPSRSTTQGRPVFVVSDARCGRVPGGFLPGGDSQSTSARIRAREDTCTRDGA